MKIKTWTMNIVSFLVVAQLVGCKDLMQQNAEAAPKKNPPTASIQDKLQLKLESETVVHPSMVALIEAIVTMLPGFPKPASLSMSTGDPNGAALPISLERMHQFDYASIPIDYPWLIQGQLSDQTPVSCQLNLDICERRRLDAEESHVITYGEYLE